MGKLWGIGGGFLIGLGLSLAIGMIVMLVTYMVFISMLQDIAESQHSSEPYMWMVLMPVTYIMGLLATVYYSYGFSYSVGLEDCPEYANAWNMKTKSV
jgi:hypothetical protein